MPAVIPAAGLLAGASIGLTMPVLWPRGALAVFIVFVVLTTAAWFVQGPRVFAACVGLAFAAGASLLAAKDTFESTHTSLIAAFNAEAEIERAAFDENGRAPPLEIPVQAFVAGVLRSDASLADAGVSVVIDVETFEAGTVRRRVRGGVSAIVVGSLAANRVSEWRAGRRVRAPVQLRRPARYLNPGVPDRERTLNRQGIVLVGTVKSGALVDVGARAAWWAEAAAAVRHRVRVVVAATVAPWSGESAAIVNAIVIGDRAGINAEVQRALQEAGTYHVIAISGGNIAILAGVLLAAFRIAGVLGRTAKLAAAGLLVAYAYLVGGGASVDRATMMAALYFGAGAWDLRVFSVNTLALVAAIAVAADPLTIADPAFVLTFGATLAILASTPIIMKSRPPRLLAAAEAMAVASLATEVMLFPVSAAVFERITVAGLGLNFLAIPLMALAQLAGMALVPVSMLSMPLAKMVGWLAHVGAAGLVWSAALVRFAPALSWRVASPSAWAIVTYYSSIAIARWMRWLARIHGSAAPRIARPGGRAALAAALAAGIWIAATPWTLLAGRGDGRLHVTFVDVGQGDSALIRFPHGAAWLIDAGGLGGSAAFDIGDRVVAPVLRSMGVVRLDGLVLTHGDPDHIGGALAVVREFRPRVVWEGIPVPRSDALAAIREAAASAGLTWRSVHRGDEVRVDEAVLSVKHPEAADWERQKVRNDYSVVIDLVWRQLSVLFTGDIGQAVEPAVAAAMCPARLRIVKVPHHGSLTSSSPEFVEASHPAVAVFSVGRGNHFGHPAPAVVERYQAKGAQIFRTDRDGAVTVDSDGVSFDVDTFSGSKRTLLPRSP